MFTLLSFGTLYFVTKTQLNRELKNFEAKFKNLDTQKAEIAKKQEIYRGILSNTSTSKI